MAEFDITKFDVSLKPRSILTVVLGIAMVLLMYKGGSWLADKIATASKPATEKISALAKEI